MQLLKALRPLSLNWLSRLMMVSLAFTHFTYGQTPTDKLRLKINEDLQANTNKQITAAKLRSVLNASADAIDSAVVTTETAFDSVFTTFSLIDNIGEYNATTGIAKITQTGVTSTPTTTPDFANGKTFDVTVAGTQSITGSSVSMVVGGKIIVRGTKWGYIPPSDAALQKALAAEAVIPTLLSKSEVLNLFNIGNAPVSGTTTLASASCYIDFSVFTAPCKLNQVDILCSTTGTFDLVQFRKTGLTTYTEVGRNRLTATTASSTVYNHINVNSLNIQILPGDAFGVVRVTAGFYKNEGVTGKSTQIVTETTPPLVFTNSGFPASPLTTGQTGREMAFKLFATENRIDTEKARLDATNTRIDTQTAEMTTLKSKIFVVPSGFNWSGDLSGLAGAQCIISRADSILGSVNLPLGIYLKFNSGGRFLSKLTNKLPAFNLSTDWTTSGGAVITNSTTFTTSAEGRIFHAGVLIPGRVYRVRIKGTTTAGSIRVVNSGDTFTFIYDQSGAFDAVHTVKYTGTTNSIGVRASGAGVTTIELFEVSETWAINSPAAYGSTAENEYPTIDNPKGNPALWGATLSGMFKTPGDAVHVADFFPDSLYSDQFLDAFVHPKYLFEKNLKQTGHTYLSINSGISDPAYRNYKGLSEGSTIEGIDGVTIRDFYLFATGDFTVRNIKVKNGRINICNMYPQAAIPTRSLKFRIENLEGTDLRIDNTFSHAAATSVLTTPEFSNVSLTTTVQSRNTVYLLSAVNANFKDVRFAYPGYSGGGGQPLILMSSLNGRYENVSSDKGDSGMMFIFLVASNTAYTTWIEQRAMDFKGFEGNLIRGGNMFNQIEEAVTGDGTDSEFPTLTMNRNRYQILSITDSEHAVVRMKYADSTNYATMVNTIMTAITKGRGLKYSKILAIVRAGTGSNYTDFNLTGPTGFFADAVVGDKYAVNYAFYNNVIEDMTFTNCKVPVLYYLYAYHNIARRLTVKGYTVSKGGSRIQSYSGRRKRTYTAASVDNIFEDCIFDENGIQIEDSKSDKEKINPWLNASPEPYESDITEDAESGTVIRNNIIRNANVKLQGLRNVVYEGNKLINVKEEITDCTFRTNSNTYINEPDNENIDAIFSSVEANGRMLIPVVSKGNGTGVTKITLRLSAPVNVIITGNGFFYDDETSPTKLRTKTLSGIGSDVSLYVRCLSGSANIIVSDQSKVTHYGGTADAAYRFDATNSPDIAVQKSRFLPKSLTNIRQTAGSFALRGNFNNLPESLTSLHIDDSNSLIEGKIADLPRTLTYVHLKFPLVYNYTPVLKGTLADIPAGCNYWNDETAGGYYTYASHTWPSTMRKVLIRISVRHSWTSAQVDQLLTELAAVTTWTGEKIVDLTGNLPARTPASNTPVSILTGKGVTVLTN